MKPGTIFISSIAVSLVPRRVPGTLSVFPDALFPLSQPVVHSYSAIFELCLLSSWKLALTPPRPVKTLSLLSPHSDVLARGMALCSQIFVVNLHVCFMQAPYRLGQSLMCYV